MPRKNYSIRWRRNKLMRWFTQNRVIAWLCIGGAAVLAVVLVLYITVWSMPNQPKAPEEMVVASVATPTPTQTPCATPVKTTTPEPTPKPIVMQDSFKELYEQNEDIVGWIKIPNTLVDYPILQTDNNDLYMNHDFEKNKHDAGSIFLDFRCDFTNMYQAAHHIIYGHNMKNGTMFQGLTKYEDEEFFKENRYITIDTLYGNYQFEVFSVYETPISFYYLETYFGDREDWLEFIKVFQEKSMHESDIELKEDDVVITLSTCTNKHIDNLRFVVHARLVNPELYDTIYTYIY